MKPFDIFNIITISSIFLLENPGNGMTRFWRFQYERNVIELNPVQGIVYLQFTESLKSQYFFAYYKLLQMS